MRVNRLTEFRDFLHAQLCYQFLITPLHFTIEKEYRDFARKACQYFTEKRTEIIQFHTPRHYVIHRFSPLDYSNSKKILIAHGWMSRAAYMIKLIQALRQQGFEVYAIDFPAHGEAKGIQLKWTDAITVLHHTLNHLGPFYAVIGHSFGGSMLLNTINLASQSTKWHIKEKPERIVLIASPTRMRIPVCQLARKFKLNRQAFLFLRASFKENPITDIRNLDFHHFTNRSKSPLLCIHGEEDRSISPQESMLLCKHYPYGQLTLLPNADHVSVLMDCRVEKAIYPFLL